MKFNDFLRSTFKIALAIFIAAIGLIVATWGYSEISSENAKNKAKKFETIKEWAIGVENLQVNMLAKTKLSGGRFFAIVEVSGYPSYLSDPRLQAKNRQADISLIFQDVDGFKLYGKKIQIAEFSKIVDASNKETGLRYEFDEYLDVELYSRFKQLRVEWTVETALPSPPSPKPSMEIENKDHCAPNLSREERLKRLARYGSLRQSGDRIYVAGSHTVSFFVDNSLLYCQ